MPTLYRECSRMPFQLRRITLAIACLPFLVPFSQGAYPDLSKGKPSAVLDARVGANIRLGPDPDARPATQRGQAEPHLVRSAANPDVLLATFQEGRHALGAFPLAPASLDALTLGSYPAIVSSADSSAGIALVEIYDAD